MITIKNTQRTVVVDSTYLKKIAQAILDKLNYSDFDLGIWITTNKTIREYNRTYRSQDKPTDILSFSFYPHLRPGERIYAQGLDEKNLGDLIISAEYVQKMCDEYKINLNDRLKVLLVHGIFHLLGYEHDKKEDSDVMHKHEQEVLEALKNK